MVASSLFITTRTLPHHIQHLSHENTSGSSAKSQSTSIFIISIPSGVQGRAPCHTEMRPSLKSDTPQTPSTHSYFQKPKSLLKKQRCPPRAISELFQSKRLRAAPCLHYGGGRDGIPDALEQHSPVLQCRCHPDRAAHSICDMLTSADSNPGAKV